MPEIVLRDYNSYEGYDACGNTTHAVLQVGTIRIPLCEECINELTESLNKFNNTIFCYKCDNFVMSQYGFNYGGSCKHKAALNGGHVTKENAGYDYCVSCMDTCPSGRLKD
jgi:hypothetical protein